MRAESFKSKLPRIRFAAGFESSKLHRSADLQLIRFPRSVRRRRRFRIHGSSVARSLRRGPPAGRSVRAPPIMASWLKAAEDLFEVVDRRAKLVVNELAEEQKNSPASNGQGSQAKRTKQRTKAVKRPSTTESPREIDTAEEHSTIRSPQIDAKPDGDTSSGLVENEGSHLHRSLTSTDDEHFNDLNKDIPVEGNATPPEKQANDMINHDLRNDEVPAAEPIVETPVSSLSGDVVNKNAPDAREERSASPPLTKVVEVADEDFSVDKRKNIEVEAINAPTKIEQERSQSAINEVPSSNGGEMKTADEIVVSSPKREKDSEHKEQASMKLQEQLDEAQGLLKAATSSGQSKEARLARVCAGLQSRLQEYKSENQQLEELLTSERELSKSYEVHIKQLQQDLSAAKNEATRVESSMAEALTAKNSEIEALLKSVDSLKTQLALSEGNLASLQVNMDSIMRNRELTETRMMQALREELASAERRAEEERAAHNASKRAAMEREVELEHRAVESSTALSRIQRTIDERTARIAELEQQKALLEVENSSLNQELHDMEARIRREQKKSPEETNKLIQMQAWQEEVASARQGQRDAENKVSTMEAELQKMKVEMAAMKRDAEHYSRQEHMELEKRYRELTDLLYYKQTQLEAMASEKAAAEFQLEKELKRTQEAQAEAERNRVSRRASSSWEEDSEMKALEPLPLYHRHMVGASIQLQKAAKLLDSGAARATRFLWRYPTARLLLLFYLVFVHLFLMYLLHHLQEQVDKFSASEVAESMGLATPTLP
ncbi:golgin candidate 1-like isoform X2 [Syzygium oleosum]|uniref:golgin candidate 1-like isoform X2 n=1 Tax=Syzygium oleosum TaxID=219896 RepID=UPI0011D2BE34|nr:golgin candidate 1-like isoform X2 [Syzygium oleosum]